MAGMRYIGIFAFLYYSDTLFKNFQDSDDNKIEGTMKYL